MRTQITQNNPESTFGEISRIVGNEVFISFFALDFLLFIINGSSIKECMRNKFFFIQSYVLFDLDVKFALNALILFNKT